MNISMPLVIYHQFYFSNFSDSVKFQETKNIKFINGTFHRGSDFVLSKNGSHLVSLSFYIIIGLDYIIKFWLYSKIQKSDVYSFLLQKYHGYSFYTPFFTTWFCALGINLFLPLYLLGRLFIYPRSAKLHATLKVGVQDLKEKGFTFGNA